MNSHKVSFIVPIYNVEQVLERCINSIIGQTYYNIELILVNDGSTDNSPYICDNYAIKDERIKVIHQKNNGVSSARNKGLLASTGKYIIFVDSDDFIDPKMTEVMINYLEKENLEMVICGYKAVNINSKELSVVKKVNYGEKILRNREEVYTYFYPFIDKNFFHKIWSKVYLSEIIKNNEILFNESISSGEDFLFNLDYVQHINSCGFIKDELYNYYKGINYLSKKYEKNTFNKRIIVIDKLRKFYENNDLDMNVVYYQYIKSAYAQFMMLFHKDCDLNFYGKKNKVQEVIDSDEISEALHNFKPMNLMQKILLIVLKTKKLNIIIFFSRLMYYIYKKLRK